LALRYQHDRIQVANQIYHQRGEIIMPQGVLPYKYEEEKTGSGMTALAGLPVWLDLASVLNLGESIATHLHVKTRGWTDEQIVLSLILLNMAGGDAVDDMDILEKDRGFSKVLNRIETRGFARGERRAMERRWRKKTHRSVPSQSAVFRFLSAFHTPEEEKKREKGKAFIPEPNEHLWGLMKIHRDLAASVQRRRPVTEATLDADATVKETYKKEALFSYKGYRAYQPFNIWWAEQELMLHTEFRDGNVPAGYEQLRVFKEALDMLPESVAKVYLRSDTAGYQHDLLRYCEKGENTRFGRIEFAIGCDVTKEFKKAVSEAEEWKPVMKKVDGKWESTGREWAEICYIPSEIAYSKNAPAYRYMATREPLRQETLPGMEQLSFPFPAMEMNTRSYKIFGIVTNRDLDGSEVVNWLYERCGKSEEAHSVMKEDLAGRKLPSSDFGENAAWWSIMVLAMNLNSAMKQLVLKGAWIHKRMKAIRFSLINLPGRIMEGAHEMMIRVAQGHPSFDVLLRARKRIMELAHGSG
jgi:hypothetical protein